MHLLIFLLLLPLTALAECRLNEDRLQEDLFTQTRALFDLESERRVEIVPRISDDTIPKNRDTALLEFISEDRFFDRPKPKGSCPDRIIRLYKFYSRDEFRRCNAILKAEVMTGIYELIYSNCGKS